MVIRPMRPDAARDRAYRRYPAHLDVVPFSVFPPVPVRNTDTDRCVPRREARDRHRARQHGAQHDHPTPAGIRTQLELERQHRVRQQQRRYDAYCDALVRQGLPDPRTPLEPCTCPDACFNEARCIPACTCRCEDPNALPPGWQGYGSLSR